MSNEIIITDNGEIELINPGIVILQGGGGGGSGTVTNVSVASANGFAATVTNPTSTPSITMRVTFSGIAKSNGTSLSAAEAGVDYLTPTGSAAGLTGLTSLQVTTALGYTPGSGNGTVTTVGIASANGLGGTVATATTTPSITLTTSVNGIAKGNGTGFSAAVAGTDYLLPTGSAAGLTGLTSLQVTTALGYTPGTGDGTVTSFAFTNANGITGTVNTATTTPTLSLSIQTANSTLTGLLSNTDWQTFNSKGNGTVTTLSVASANGMGGTVANATTTPAITLTTSVNGLVKGDGAGFSAATAGTDYLLPTGSAAGLTGLTSTQVTTALGFTPYNSTNPSGYISGNQTITFTGDATGSGTTAVTLTIANDAVTFAKMQNVASGVLLGRYDASTGDIQTITIGTNLTLTDAGVLNASGGGGGGSGTVTDFVFTDANGFDGTVSTSTTTPTLSLAYTIPSAGQLMTAASSDPATPSAGIGNFYSLVSAARSVPKYKDEFGIDSILQSSFAQKKIRAVIIGAETTGSPGLTYIGQGSWSFSGTGTATARTPAVTSFFTRCARLGIVSSAGAGSFAGARSTATHIIMGNGSGLGGFYRVFRFGCSDAATVSGARQFCGFRNTISAPSNVEPSTLTNCIGVGNGASDTNLQIFYGGSSAQTPIDLGANFPANTLSVDVYEAIFFAPASSNNTVYYQITRLNTSNIASGTLTGTAGVALPSATTYLNHSWFWRCNNATALAVGLDLFLDYLETDY